MTQPLMDTTLQCCDADSYLKLGYDCTAGGNCFDYIRPVGIIEWFSLPFRLGVSVDILFWLQVAMLVVACAMLLCLFINASSARSLAHKKLALLGWLASLVMIYLWLKPTFYHSLSDTPSSLLLLLSVFFILLASEKNNMGWYVLAGCLLGCVPLFRLAYFYPVVVSLAVLLGIWLLLLVFSAEKMDFIKQQWKPLLLLISIFPLSLQFFHNQKHTGKFSFSTDIYSEDAYALHLDNRGAGYDTFFPQNGVYWSPYCSVDVYGLVTDLKSGSYAAVLCLLKNRAEFYFGSYASPTYLGEFDRNFLDNGGGEAVGQAGFWSLHNMGAIPDVAISPLGDKSAVELHHHVIVEHGPDSFAQTTSIMPIPAGKYVFSIWLWSKSPRSLDVRISNYAWKPDVGEIVTVLSQTPLQLSKTPVKFSLPVDNPVLGNVYIRMGWFGDPTRETVPISTFHAWGSRLELADVAHGYSRPVGRMGVIGNVHAGLAIPERWFSTGLLLVNVLVICTCFVLLLVRSYMKKSLGIFFVGTLLAMVIVQCMLVIPEQRFVQGLLMSVWSIFFLLGFQYLKQSD